MIDTPESGCALAYARVSTIRQDALSEIMQISNFCLERGYVLPEEKVFIDEGTSAFMKSLNERKHGKRLLAAIEPGDVVIVTAVDRLLRRMEDMFSVYHWIYRERGASLIILDDPEGNAIKKAESMLKFAFQSWIAESESQVKSARMKGWHAARKARGYPVRNQFVTGYRRKVLAGGKVVWVRHEPTYTVVGEAYRRWKSGEALYSIGRDFQKRKVRTAHGTQMVGYKMSLEPDLRQLRRHLRWFEEEQAKQLSAAQVVIDEEKKDRDA